MYSAFPHNVLITITHRTQISEPHFIFSHFMLGWLNWVDFLAIAPYYVELVLPGGPGLAWVRVLRLTRIFRLFKLGRYQEGFLLFYLYVFPSPCAPFFTFFCPSSENGSFLAV